MRFIAVDWSGKRSRAEESIWTAEVRAGRLTDLRNGLGRAEVVERLIGLAERDPRIVVGLDFGFSFPGWWCAEQGWSGGEDVWGAMAEHGERLLAACPPPLWGR